jgi:hypothetical protein
MKSKLVPVLNQLSTKPRKLMGQWRYSSTFLTLALDGREWSVSRPYRFTPVK